MGPVLQLLDARGMGGIERHVEVLCRALRDAGADARPFLYADYGPTDVTRAFEAAGLTVERGDGSFRGLRRDLRRLQPCLLHTHGYKAGIMGRIAARLLGIPVVSTFHAGERAPFPVGAYQAADRWTSCLGSRIAVSGPIAATLPFATGVVPNFVELPPAEDRAHAREIAFVGRLSHEKGPDLFCAAARATGSRGAWTVYGDGPMRRELESAYGGVVTFKGMTDMRTAWRNIGLLLITSRAEGLPMAALEALAHGIPVVAHRVGGLPDLITPETGDLVEIGNIAGLHSAVMRRLPNGPEARREQAEACRALIASRYGAREGVARILAIYEEAGADVLRAGPFPVAICDAFSGETR